MPVALRSNSGDDEFVIEFVAPAEYAHDAGFECSIRLRGVHWDGDQTYPLSSSMERLWLRAADLSALRDHISDWCNQPLDQLRSEELNGEFRLARFPSQNVQLRFGSRPDTISGLNPVVSINFSAGALRGEFHFVTDQSCLTLFAEELSAQLIALQRS